MFFRFKGGNVYEVKWVSYAFREVQTVQTPMGREFYLRRRAKGSKSSEVALNQYFPSLTPDSVRLTIRVMTARWRPTDK